MHARVVDLRVRPMETEEVVRIYRDSVVPAARDQTGFNGALLLTDSTGIGLSITLWETEEDRELGEASGYFKEQIEKFADHLVETPVRKHYDVGVLHYEVSALSQFGVVGGGQAAPGLEASLWQCARAVGRAVTEEGDTTGEFSSDVLEPVRASFEKQGLMRLIGAEVVEAGRDGA